VIGLRRARANASAANGEWPSVRIMLPIDMKNLIGGNVSAVGHSNIASSQYAV